MRKHKIILIALIACFVCSAIQGFALEDKGCAYCTVSSNNNENDGKCKPRADGLGDECTPGGSGTKCNGDEFAVCPN